MEVTIRVRALEPPWGSGLNDPILRKGEIADVCPRCGGPRGIPQLFRQHDDGVTYYVSVWENPCGHTDKYKDVAVEAGMVMADGA